MNFDNILDLSVNLIYQKELDSLFSQIEEEMKKFIFTSVTDFSTFFHLENAVVSQKVIFSSKSQKLFFLKHFFNLQEIKKEDIKKNIEIENLDKFLREKPSIYWWLFFYILFSKDFYINFNNDDKRFYNFYYSLFVRFLPNLFKLYKEERNDVILKFLNNSNMGISNSMYNIENIFIDLINKKFEDYHQSLSSFLFLVQYKEIPKELFPIYENQLFSKYFQNLKKDSSDYFDYQNFWSYLIRFQKIPISYIFKYIKTFQDDLRIKKALNYSNYCQYYWNEIEKNRLIYSKLKLFE